MTQQYPRCAKVGRHVILFLSRVNLAVIHLAHRVKNVKVYQSVE